MPPRLLTTMKYCDNFATGNITSGSIFTQQFNLNSIWDPDRTGSGHNPMGYLQIAPFYNRYRVMKCKWRATFQPTSDRYYAVVAPLNNLWTTTTAIAIMEQPRAIIKAVGYQGGNAVVIKGQISIPNLIGVTYKEYHDDRFQATLDANPAEATSLVCNIINSSGNTIVTSMNIVLKYYVELFDVVQLPLSPGAE